MPTGTRGEITIVVTALLAPIVWWIVVNHARPEPIADEVLHQKVVAGLTQGQWPRPGYLTVLPAYHAVAAALTRPWGGALPAARAVTVVLAVVAGWLAWRLARRRNGDRGAAALLILGGPLVLPFTALVYTDVPALCLLLLATWAAAAGRWWMCAAAVIAAFLIRQTSAIWLLLFALAALRDRPPARAALARLVPLGVALVVCVVVGVAVRRWIVGAQISIQPAVNPAQFYIFGLCVAVVWAPLWIEELLRMWTATLRPALMRGWGAAAILAASAAIALLYTNPHPWNADPDYLRNRLLVAMQRSEVLRTIICTAVAIGGGAAVHFARRQANAGELAVIGCLSLVFLAPHPMVDPRYYIVPIALLHVAIRYTPVQARRLALWNGLLALTYCAYLASDSAAAIW